MVARLCVEMGPTSNSGVVLNNHLVEMLVLPRTRPSLTQENKRKRLQFAALNAHMPADFWRNVTFIDEQRFWLVCFFYAFALSKFIFVIF